MAGVVRAECPERCGAPVEEIRCLFCGAAYIGPDCGHVAQPTFVAGCAGCGRAVCEDCVSGDGFCPECEARRGGRA